MSVDIFSTVEKILSFEPVKIEMVVDEHSEDTFAVAVTKEGKRHQIQIGREQLHLFETIFRNKKIHTTMFFQI